MPKPENQAGAFLTVEDISNQNMHAKDCRSQFWTLPITHYIFHTSPVSKEKLKSNINGN